MLALPIIGVSAADLTYRSGQLSTAQQADRQLGAADVRLRASGLDTALYQSPGGDDYAPVGGFDAYTPPANEKEPDRAAALLPPGAQSLKDSRGYGKIRTRHGLLGTDLREVDAHSPLVKGLLTPNRGRLPERPGEVIATDHFLESSGLFVGSSFTPRGSQTRYTIVGTYENPSDLRRAEVLAPPGTLIAPLDKELTAAGSPGIRSQDSYLVKVGGDGFTWNMVKTANAKGVLAVSRTVLLAPPADSEVPLYQQEGKDRFGGGAPKSELAVLATVVGLAMLEICLLAGPAFAVGARRSRRQLGLVGANGGDRRHIRAIVLSGGIVLGAAAAVLGTGIGMALTAGLRPVLEDYLGERFGGFRVRPAELAAIALLAVVTGLLAAVVPAVTASRETVLASLTGRRGVRRANRVLPVIGLLACAAGAVIAVYGATSRMGATVVAGGSALAELGVVALTPTLVGLFGRLGRWLPLSPRLALRDAVRNRGRTAPAVAAVLAAVAGTVAVATYQNSQEVQNRQAYVASLPDRTGLLETSENSAHKEVPALRQALARELPLDQRADVDRLVVGKPGCDQYSSDEGCGRVEIIVPKEQRCPLFDAPNGPASFTEEQALSLRADPRCKTSEQSVQYATVVADEKLLSVLAVDDPGSAAALASGRAVSFDARETKDGKVTLRIVTDGEAADRAQQKHEDPPGQDKVFPVHQAPATVNSWGVHLVLPPAAVKSAGLATAPLGSYFTLDGAVATEQKQRMEGEMDRLGVEASLTIEEGYQGTADLSTLVLTVFAGLVTIGAAGIATGLAQADSEADLKTLAAVGAPPRVRRTLSGFQCGVIALMGVVLGSAAGILPAVGLRMVQRQEQEHLYRSLLGRGLTDEAAPYVPIAVPWETLGGLLVVVPLGAALLAALVTRSNGALARRAAG
ncbi:FtsX-like permease family protein [Streptomyces sp. NPDC058655]|uniref:FtsX-like permease family protein n=1 Tax=Streptomyces sp. NPDC058655 TaxID=3346577 RepID=UPI00365153AA